MTDSKPPEPRAEQEHQQRDAASEEKSAPSNSKPTEDRGENEQVEWYERVIYQTLLFAGGIALFSLVLVLMLDLYIDPQTSTQKRDLVQALGLITAGVAGVLGIFFTQRNTQEQLRLSQQSQEQNQKSTQAQLDNAQEELRLTRQGQITERFTRAIDQLGSEKLEIRLGSIYALERIDKESPERAYHGTVMEVLTAYVRENSRREPEEPSTASSASNEGVEQDKDVAQEQDGQPTLQRLPTDIQAIIDVLNRREEEHVPKEHSVLLDLRGANLQGASLTRANLQVAFLQGADLHGAHLQVANLEGAFLEGANLQGAFLEGANLQGADLHGAYLHGATLIEANLQGANLLRANLEGANLEGANLEGAFLIDANLQEAYLQGAHLQGVTLWWAANLQQDQIKWTLGSNETKLGKDLDRPELWSKSIEEQERIVREHFEGD